MSKPIGLNTIEKLHNIVGANGSTTDPDIIAPHLSEWRGKYFGHTPMMLMPKSAQEISAIVKLADEEKFAICTQGGNTGLVGAQIPFGEVLLSLKRMDAIRAINEADDSIIAEAGVVLANVHAAVKNIDRQFPVSLASNGSATIGGLISTNAGGVRVRRYGMMRNQIMGLEVVLPNGEIMRELSPLRKDNSGYDLKQLIIGAEGTLGIVTAACLKLVPSARNVFAAMASLDKVEDAINALRRLENETGAVSAFEIMNCQAFEYGLKNLVGSKNPLSKIAPFTALIEFECAADTQNCENALMALLGEGLFGEVAISQNIAQFEAFWQLREGMSAAQKPEGLAAKHDISVPISAVSEFMKLAEMGANKIVPNVRIAAFGHIGDGNIHYDVLRPIEMHDDEYRKFIPSISHEINNIAIGLGGSISAEHGIGVAKRDEFLAREPSAQLSLMRKIKALMDPNNILNPRVLV
ncbi:MAG: FAD/FMN-containing dehydrogenase [Hyphomonadaceae bacterium]|nr:MAG: FAD/FMN-containing dehydrogenase [Hyphomonadaceae bacterium]